MEKINKAHALHTGNDIDQKAVQAASAVLLLAAPDEQGVDRDADNEHQQRRHEDLGERLDALVDAAVNDKAGGCQKDDKEDDRLVLIGDKAGEEAVVRRVQALTGDEHDAVFEHPAADHAVVRKNQKRHRAGKAAQPSPAPVDLAVSRQAALLGLSADGHLADKQRKAKGQRQNNVHDEKQAAAVFRRQIRETPNISESDRRACRGKHKADGTGKGISLLFHNAPLVCKKIICKGYYNIIISIFLCIFC